MDKGEFELRKEHLRRLLLAGMIDFVQYGRCLRRLLCRLQD